MTPSALDTRRFGLDLVLPDDGGVRVGPDGDWPTVEGLDCLKVDLVDRAITNPGELVHRPDYGCGAESFVERPATPATRAELIQRLRLGLARDPRISESTVSTKASAGRLDIALEVLPRGASDSKREQVAFTLE